MATFRQFMRARQKDGNHTNFGGDFIDDALADRELPNVKSWDQLYDFMTSFNRHNHGACREAIEGALDVWTDYVRFQIREGEFETESERAFVRSLKRKYPTQRRERDPLGAS